MSRVRDESGFSLMELVVAATISIIVLFGVFAMADISLRNSKEIQGRVEANQKARTTMQHILVALHSTCLGPGSTPIMPGSTSNEIRFQHQTGAAVSPVPDMRTITFGNGTLVERVYPSTGGEVPTWTFATTPSRTRTLLEPAATATLGNPGGQAQVFRYYADDDGSLSATPLPVPLSVEDAARTVSVTVAFSALPNSASTDPKLAVSLTDSAYLRFSPFSEDVQATNAPCD